MINRYKTIAKEGRSLFKDRGSKFLGFAYPVDSEHSIKERLDQLRKSYHDARHHCYAYVLEPDGRLYRANDDGEPVNSAGKPILAQIEGRSLKNVLVVVVRYFGGTLLGVGGLIQAYRKAASEAIEKGEIIIKHIHINCRLWFEYHSMDAVMRIIKEHRLNQWDQQFELSCSLMVSIRKEDADSVIRKLKLADCRIEILGTG